MSFFPNFREFYQRTLIFIGENDRLSILKKEIYADNLDFCTHWLFALEGNEVSQETGDFNWKVVVYPANTKGSFDYKKPYIVSPLYKSFNDAIEYTRELEKLAKEDQIGQIFSIAN